jgi:hypothetical protein
LPLWDGVITEDRRQRGIMERGSINAAIRKFEDELFDPDKSGPAAEVEPANIRIYYVPEDPKDRRPDGVCAIPRLPADDKLDCLAVFLAARQGKLGQARAKTPITLIAMMPLSRSSSSYRVAKFQVQGQVVLCDYEETETIPAKEDLRNPCCVADLPPLPAGKYMLIFRAIAKYRKVGDEKPIVLDAMPELQFRGSFTIAPPAATQPEKAAVQAIRADFEQAVDRVLPKGWKVERTVWSGSSGCRMCLRDTTESARRLRSCWRQRTARPTCGPIRATGRALSETWPRPWWASRWRSCPLWSSSPIRTACATRPSSARIGFSSAALG